MVDNWMPVPPCGPFRACADAHLRSNKVPDSRDDPTTPRRGVKARLARQTALALICALLMIVPRAHAQVSGSVAVESDYRLHAYSVTGNHPAVTAQISWDDPTGFYANGAVIGSLTENGDPDVAGAIANVGMAVKASGNLSLDGGYLRRQYLHSDYFRQKSTFHTDELYVGAVFHGLAYHVYYSPDYLGYHVTTLYHEVAGGLPLPGKLQLTGRAGLILYLDAPPQWHLKSDYDWSVGLTRPVGRVSLNLMLDGGRSGLVRFYQTHALDGTRLVGGVSIAF
jgi:uncharacterized protein (TIGR02001 family)